MEAWWAAIYRIAQSWTRLSDFKAWQINGETVETVAGFILGGSKITVDGDCSHEIKRCGGLECIGLSITPWATQEVLL